jgi:hypothetical protein
LHLCATSRSRSCWEWSSGYQSRADAFVSQCCAQLCSCYTLQSCAAAAHCRADMQFAAAA